jgi:4-amino-4-deoxy-L-arabinose transferase-like glycosyltransferase
MVRALWISPRAHASVVARARALLPGIVFALALGLYVRSGAPTLLSGDQAEHQMVAVLVGVPHATGYPLFTLVNALAVRLLPVDDLARRVTLVTAFWSALAVMFAYLVAHRLTGSALIGLVSAATLATSSEFWSLSTIAEVYTLQALLILAVWYALLHWWENPTQPRSLYAAALLAGLGVTHHGSFVPIVVPALVLVVGLPLLRAAWRRRAPWGIVGWAIGCGMLGLLPWAYLGAQFVLFRPFDFYRGQGLPYHYYWGNPTSWSDVVNLALGGGFRGAVFTHGWERLPELLWRFVRTLRNEVWWSGVLLGVLGAWTLLHRPLVGLWSGMIFVSAALFGINVAADIPKAHVYYLPAYIVWSVWAGVGAGFLAGHVARAGQAVSTRWQLPYGATSARRAVVLLVLLLPLLLGWHRWERLDRSQGWATRRFAEEVLVQVASDAVILCRWELCLPLQYLQLVEARRLDVQLDQTEPEAGADWAERTALYWPQHPVYAVQYNQQLAARYRLALVSNVHGLWRVEAEGAPHP